MKIKFIITTVFLISTLLTNTFQAQNLPKVKVDGNDILVVTDAFPLWLKEGQSLEISSNTQFISVLEFNKEPLQGGGNSLIFEDVVIVTTPAATVPNGKVWKVEYVGLNDNVTLAGSIITQANSCQTPSNLQITNNENASVTINWNAPPNPPAYGYSISVMPAGIAPTSNDFFTVTGTTITVSTFSHDNSHINATTPGVGIDVYLISTCNVVTNEYSDPVNSQGTVTCEVDNLQLTDNLNGTITANWTEAISGFTPANGYMVAVVPQGTTPQPGDYVAENSTSFTTGNYTDNNFPFMGFPDIDVYVYAVCNANSNSDPINTNITLSCTPFTLNFTNCTSTGNTGPTQANCNNTYNNTPIAFSGGVTVTSGIQYYTVPSTGIYEIEVGGAKGFGTNHGAIMKATLTLTQNDVLKILVGQQPGDVTYGAGGGTFVALSDNTPLLVAGGGGGRSNNNNGRGSTNTSGNSSTGSGGTNGSGGIMGSSGAGGGGGGFTGDGTGTYGGKSFTNGGNGGAGSWPGGFGGGGAINGSSGGGGGGGYSGGGGSTSSNYGGGGGSYIDASATNVATSDGNYDGSGTFNGNPITNLNSYRNGHGYVNIQLICP